ncbi:biotin--[acetyl-CoA-carboxylase] ligase [Halobacterium jilantaiense]|uniref:BirA family transcriptional regulator, biotin operon repressor / biotin-[acetyl-CoA-carboxylase] ligase n=1 Tax=Halobacterium jilantaiense TaxID=355548 RepID=A0A1I0NFR9_9EURY|nr:biotin--[acetyl-CoA-carboxylase] ligase [Halobacterium jilantaiense]SEV99864.1 BirA family transcriptional regulator, biotin operon repressor / biotin-[acetyl-CoA-carboxylase] ligase [Halobacterium jilantaiense]
MTVDPDELRARLDAPLVHRETCPSTNDIARAEGRDGAAHGTFVVADEQTAGRGRTGNVWASPPGGVWSSTLVRPDFAASHVGRLTFAGGLAAAETVEEFGVDARLKWPNDVVVDRDDGTRAKLCGVLTEAVVDEVPVAGKPVDDVLPGTDPETAALSFAVLGIGVNASLAPGDLNVGDRTVTTLREEVGAVDPTEVAATLHDRLLDWTASVETDDGFADAVDAFRDRSATLGERVEVTRRDDDPVVGDAVSVTGRGALVVDTGERRVEVQEGECRRLRRT